MSFEGLLERNKVFKSELPQRRPQSPIVTNVIWEKSKEEHGKGWLSDFLSAEDLDQMFGKVFGQGFWTFNIPGGVREGAGAPPRVAGGFGPDGQKKI